MLAKKKKFQNEYFSFQKRKLYFNFLNLLVHCSAIRSNKNYIFLLGLKSRLIPDVRMPIRPGINFTGISVFSYGSILKFLIK